MLAGEREELAAVLRNLSVAMIEVRSFVKENRASLTSNISGLNKISKILTKRRDALNEILRVAPAALNNLYLAGNSPQGTLDTRNNANETFNELQTNPAQLLCNFVSNDSVCNTIKQALAKPRPGALTGDGSVPVRVNEPIDRSMGGLLEVAP